MRKPLKSYKFSKILLLMSIFAPALWGQTSDQQAVSSEFSSDKKPSEHPVVDAAVEATKKTAEVGEVAHRAREGIHAATKPSSDSSKDKEENDEGKSEDENDKSAKETLKEKGKDLKDKAGDAKDDAVAGVKKGKRKAERAVSDAKDTFEEKPKDIKDKVTG
ncbi:MAG: hypothetical protein K2W94_00400 [Alphaproteobacteria bacterium]|nr:hypothetical protein [Alphaproteobacteria bacterium]